jgi:hypothetical protein
VVETRTRGEARDLACRVYSIEIVLQAIGTVLLRLREDQGAVR